MADRLFIPAHQVSREQLRDIGIRVYGSSETFTTAALAAYPMVSERELTGHFIAPSATEKLEEAGFRVYRMYEASADGSEDTTKPMRTPHAPEGDVGLMAIVAYANGHPAVADTPPSAGVVNFGINNGVAIPLAYKLRLSQILSEKLTPVVRKPIRVDVPHGELTQPLVESPEYVVHVWSGPRSGGPSSIFSLPATCEKLFNVELPAESICNDTLGIQEWDECVSIRTPEGITVGVFDASNLYVYLDLVHVGTDTELAVWEKLAEYVAANFARTAGPDHAELRAKYVEVASRRFASVLTRMKGEVDSAQREIATVSTNLGQLLFKRDKLMLEIKRAEEDSVSDTSALAREYDNIMKMPFVKRIRFADNTVTVLTDVAFVVDPRSGKEHEVGAFKIVFDLARVTCAMLNQTRLVSGYENRQMHAPHVFPDGQPCMGNLQESLPHLLKEFRLCDAIGLVWGYLCSVNVDDGAGKHVNKWPLSAAQKAKDAAAAEATRRVAEAASPAAVVAEEAEDGEDA